MKRVISLFLSVVMLFSIIAGVDLSAYAEVNNGASVTTINIERSFEEHMLGSTFAVSASYVSDAYSHNEDTISYEISGTDGGLILDGGMSCIGTKEDGIVSIPLKAVKIGTYTVTLKTIDGATDSITIEINEKLYNVYVASRLFDRKEKMKNTNMLYHYIFSQPLDTTDFLTSWYINDDFKANKEYYYETVLLDILLKQSNDKDYISYLNKTIENISSKCISYSLNYFEDSTENAIKSKKFSSLTTNEQQELNQAYENATGINDIWDAVSSIKSGVDTVKDYFDKLSAYAALQNVNEKYIEVLRYINILALQDSHGELSVNATLLSNACENLVEIYSNKNVAVADCFKKSAETIIWDLTEEATQEALKIIFGDAASTIKITKDVSLLIANSVFAAEDIFKSSCLIKTTNYIEKYLKEALDSCGSEFKSNPEQYADDYIACHELLISCFNYGESVHKYYSDLLYNDTVSAKVGTFF